MSESATSEQGRKLHCLLCITQFKHKVNTIFGNVARRIFFIFFLSFLLFAWCDATFRLNAYSLCVQSPFPSIHKIGKWWKKAVDENDRNKEKKWNFIETIHNFMSLSIQLLHHNNREEKFEEKTLTWIEVHVRELHTWRKATDQKYQSEQVN